MSYSRSSCFYLCFCVYLTLVVAGVITDKDAVNTRTLLSTADALNVSSIFTVSENNTNCKNVCYTPGCVYEAMKVMKNMDSEMHPCDNFYKFSCHGFENSTIIPDDQPVVISLTYNTIMKQLRATVEEKSSPNEPRAFRLTKDLYRACMNETAIEKLGSQPLLDNLEKLGGWPVLKNESLNESDFNWIDSVYKSRNLGYSINNFINLGVKLAGETSNSKHVVYLNVPSTFLPNFYYTKGFNTTEIQEYYEYMVESAVLLGADRHHAARELRESLEFEIKLAKMSIRKRDDLVYKNMTVNELSISYPSIPWLEYINTILAPISHLMPNETVIVTNRRFLQDFEILINTTSKRTLANYALWRAVDESFDFSDAIRKLKLRLYGEGQFRWEKCVRFVSDHLDFSLNSMNFNNDSRSAVVEMLDNIKSQFTQILQEVDWMDEKTRANALEKMHRMESYIVYPDELLDIEEINKIYEKLELNANDPLGNMLNMTIFETNRLFNMLNMPASRNEWWRRNLRPTSFGAYYKPSENTIQISASMMQDIYFNNSRPHYMNYGAIGSVIGHEITHGFDNKGIHYDKNGDRVDWWEPKTKEDFFNRTQCIIDQYSNYTDEDVGMHLNGKNTVNEDVADNGGLKAAYYAYKRWALKYGREMKLPGLPYTPKQMFWISHANAWCTKYRRDVLIGTIETAVHSPAEFRVNGALANMREFSQDFNCPIGSKMNPVKKCIVW